MSSIDDCIAAHERSAERAKLVRDRFPDARVEVLWTDGPEVFTAPPGEWADEVYAAIGRGLSGRPEALLFPCATLRGEDIEAIVFARPSFGGAWVSIALDRLKKADPAAYAALVKCAMREGL